MPYLQVDLDGKRKWPMVAAGLHVSEAQVAKGFLDLWEMCWREKTSTVSLLYLECLFGAPGERVAVVLCELGFLEAGQAGHRVRGADKYLRITEARSAGGKKAAGNLKRGKSPGSSRKAAGKQPEDTPGSGPALTPNTEHQSPSIEATTSVGLLADRVFEHWRRVMGKNGNTAFDSSRRTKVEARLNDGYSPDDLCRAVDGCAKTPHNMGENDRGERYDDLALICRDAAHVDRFMRNATAPPKRAGGARFYAAQDADKTAFEKTGTLDGF